MRCVCVHGRLRSQVAPGVVCSFGSLLAFEGQAPGTGNNQSMRSAQELERHGLTADEPLANCSLFFPSKDFLDPVLAETNRSFEMLMRQPDTDGGAL
jgi:hypothetical protein